MSSDAVTVFFSYSHKDEALRDELANHLTILRRNNVITDWHDRDITAGDEWRSVILGQLTGADIILLLISSDFLASDFCWNIELQQAIERHRKGNAVVIPIILREVDWKGAPFGDLQALPKNAQAVTTWSTIDAAFKDVAISIRKTVNDLKDKRARIKQGNLEQYEAAYRQAIQQQYPLPENIQAQLDQLQDTLVLSSQDVAPIKVKLNSQVGEAQQRLENYRQEVRHCLGSSGGKITIINRTILNGFQASFGLTADEAEAIEQTEIAPYEAKIKSIAQYESVLGATLQQENPLSQSTRSQMSRLQTALDLSDNEVKTIETALQRKADAQRLEREHPEDYRQQEEHQDEEVELQEREAEDTPTLEEGKINPKSSKLKVKRKELHECESSKILFLKNVRDPNGGWAYNIDRIREMGGSVESRVFELFWLLTSKGSKSASKGDLMLLNQHAKITHVVEMLDNEVRENEVGYFRWVRVVWMPKEEDWSQLSHQRDIIGFEPPTIGGGTAYSLANLSKFQAVWNSLEAFQQHVFRVLTGTGQLTLDESLSSEQFGANYSPISWIIDSMVQEIGEYLLGDELSEYASGSNNSASGWHCDYFEITNAYWSSKGQITFSAEIHFSGMYDIGASMFGPNQMKTTVNGVLNDRQCNSQFSIDTIEVVSIEESDFGE